MRCVYTSECNKHHAQEVDWNTRIDQARLIVMSEPLTAADWLEAATYINEDELMKAADDCEKLGQLWYEAKCDMLDDLIKAKAHELGEIS